jgi:hypothetical protein
MKHLLNDLSEEEKNRIREQHTGGKKFIIENFKKLVDTRLGDAKPYLNETEKEGPKPGGYCEGEKYYLGQTQKTAKEVSDYIDANKVFGGMKCINNKLRQVTCTKKEDGTLKCDEATN